VRTVSGARTGDALTPLTPARIADTRTGSGQPYAGQTIAANGTLAIQATGRGGVPANARSVVAPREAFRVV
jgi:hypothetical protein